MNQDTAESKSKKAHRKFIRINGKLMARSFSRKVDAERWYAEMKRKKELDEAGLEVSSDIPSLQDFAERWLMTRKANGQPMGSFIQEEARLRLYVIPAYGSRDLNKIPTRDWEKLLNELGSKFGLSPATRNRVRALLSKLYNDALRERIVGANPITVIPKSKERSKKWDYWTSHGEVQQYLIQARKEGEAFSIFAHLALNTGARVSEILALEHQDVDLEKRRIRIWRIVEASTAEVCERTKGFNERWLGINDSLYAALKEQRLNLGKFKPSEPLVANLKGERLLQRSIRAIHLRCCKKAEVKVLRVHDLRHTFASHYIMNGGSLAELQGLLGHTSPAMTLKYAHMAPGFLESRASVVSFGIRENPPTHLVRVR